MDIVFNNCLIPDFFEMKWRKVSVGIENGVISRISDKPLNGKIVINAREKFLTPGLIDCHCHIESSYLVPANFSKVVASFGTLHVVADPHEISNVRGKEGFLFFVENAKHGVANIKFAVSSCVPATEFNTSGGRLGKEEIFELLELQEVVALGELMNVPGVVQGLSFYPDIIKRAKELGKRVNGHAPHLDDEILKRYVAAGAEDDHESYSYEELKKKIELGMKVFIREGSPEKTRPDAYRILREYPDDVMFCTDDKTIEDILKKGHINYNVKKAIRNGIPEILAVKAATYNGLKYYGLEEYAEIKVGNKAWVVLFDEDFDPVEVVVDGKFMRQMSVGFDIPAEFLNTFNLPEQKDVPTPDLRDVAMVASDGTLITHKLDLGESMKEDYDLENDILKIVVYERYGHGRKAASFIKGFGLKRGAIATSLSHDCHNILAVGTSDEAILKVINAVIDMQGGQALFDGEKIYELPLRVGGVVSEKEPVIVASEVRNLKDHARLLGSSLTDPFSTLTFMALEVIPHLKLTDRGLFDVDKFEYLK